MSTPSSLRQHQVRSNGGLGGATTPLSSSSNGRPGIRSPIGAGMGGAGNINNSTKQGEYAQMVKELRGLMAQEKRLVLGTLSEINENYDRETQTQQQPYNEPPTVVSAKVPLHSVSSFVSNIELRTQHSPNDGLLGVSIFDEGGLQLTAAGELDDGAGSMVGALSRVFQLCRLMESPILPSSYEGHLHKVFSSSPPEKGPEQLGEEVWASDIILRTEQALNIPIPISLLKTRSELHSIVIEIDSGVGGSGGVTAGDGSPITIKRSSSVSYMDNSSFAKPNAGNKDVGPQTSPVGRGRGRVICLAPCTNDLAPSREEIDAATKALQNDFNNNNNSGGAKNSTSLLKNSRAVYEAQCVAEKAARITIERSLDEISRHQRDVLNSMAFVCGRSEKAVHAMEVLHHRQRLARSVHSSLINQSNSRGATTNSESLVLATVHSVAS